MTNNTLQKQLFQAGSILLAVGVITGALGSHAMKGAVQEYDLNVYEVAVRYQIYHSMGLLILGIGARRIREDVLKGVFALFLIGIILFSGSLYLLSTSIMWANERLEWFGAVAPFGGVSFIAGWLYLGLKGYKPSTHSSSGEKIVEMHRRKTEQ
ncbi:MAG: DUF423 domain-containing protein [Bacteroidota bacterium]|jgi:uncharacterized membrane protein YgdD (TMEM256/DUF423 family)